MRITSPDPGARMDIDDIDLLDPSLYTEGEPHLAWQTLRADCPLHWTPGSGDRPGFWSVTRREDVVRILREHEAFTSERCSSLAMLGHEDPGVGRMMVMTDPPRHGQLRQPMNKPLSARAVPDYAAWIRDFVRRGLTPIWDGDEFDAAALFARLPIATITHLMSLPPEDNEELLANMYANAAFEDPAYQHGSAEETLRRAHYEIVGYFDAAVEQRRKNPGHDLVSHLLDIEFDGKPMDDETAIMNCYSLMLGATVTTSQSINAAIVAIAEPGDGIGRWSPEIPVVGAVEETLRWSSPALQFTRYATRDVEMHGRTIRSGDALAAWIPSANRDEEVFADPYRFDPYRTPGRHIAFGAGTHRCVGISLARLTLRIVFEEFFARIAEYELTEDPTHIRSVEIAGIRRLPMRIRAAR